MSGLTQLQPPLYVVTPFGSGIAYFVHTDSQDTFFWGVFQDATGESWWWDNTEVRLCKNLTEHRHKITPFHLTEERKTALAPHMARHGISQ